MLHIVFVDPNGIYQLAMAIFVFVIHLNWLHVGFWLARIIRKELIKHLVKDFQQYFLVM
jgi:hypothetical protein